MNIWTFRPAICLVLGLGVSACDTLPVPMLSFAPILSAQNEQGRIYSSAQMLNGAFKLVPPEGYCIDGGSLTQTFALMTHCKVLAADKDDFVDETDVLTATFSTKTETKQPTVQDLSDALSPLTVRHGYTENQVAYVEVTDPQVQPALDPVHWRGAMLHNGTVIGFASYAPKGLDASAVLIKRASANILEHNGIRPDTQADDRTLKSSLKSIVGLFQ